MVHECEMRDLAYALTCQSLQEVATFRDWTVACGRAKLVTQMNNMVVGMEMSAQGNEQRLPPARLKRSVRSLQGGTTSWVIE